MGFLSPPPSVGRWSLGRRRGFLPANCYQLCSTSGRKGKGKKSFFGSKISSPRPNSFSSAVSPVSPSSSTGLCFLSLWPQRGGFCHQKKKRKKVWVHGAHDGHKKKRGNGVVVSGEGWRSTLLRTHSRTLHARPSTEHADCIHYELAAHP